MPTPVVTPLAVAGRTVARYLVDPDVPSHLSPRPYFHPVTTLDGTVVTQALPPEHPHHLGVSVAIPDAAGANFWGGRTFRSDVGPIWLSNHGSQHHQAWNARDPDRFDESLTWYAVDGTAVFDEHRTVRASPLDGERAWVLRVSFTLTNLSDQAVDIRSPATNGRPGAGYGGFFWRVPRIPEDISVHTALADTEAEVHGSVTRWLTLNGHTTDGRHWGLVFVHDVTAPEGGADRWFVRTRNLPAVGLSLAWDEPLRVAPGAQVRRRVWTVVADGPVDRARSEAVAAQVPDER